MSIRMILIDIAKLAYATTHNVPSHQTVSFALHALHLRMFLQNRL